MSSATPAASEASDGQTGGTGASDTGSTDDLTAPLIDPTFYAGDPFPLYARLRAEAPVVRNPTLGFWVVSRHADVTAVSRDADTFCSSKGVMVFEIGNEYPTPPTIMHTDPPDHTRYRALVQPGFRPKFMRGLEDAIRARTKVLVDRLEPGEPVDIVSELAVPLPLQVISDLLGVPEHEWPRFFRWSESVIPGATDWPEEERQALSAEMVEYLLAAAAGRRTAPGSDIISELAAAEIDGDRLSDAELAMFLVQLLVAGNETTRNMVSGGLVAFAETPGEWAALRAQVADSAPRALAIATEEMLRWTTPVVSFMRTATRDTVVGDQEISRGDPVLMLYASANRDEAVFGSSGERFHSARDPNPHLAFGFGAHFCIGAALARQEGRIVLEELLARFGSVESAGPVERTPSPVIAGVRSAPMVFGTPAT
ncbi:MAG TPA: cytochrome P450 [Acidimicrobiales bacterium]|nr:cytochrome P450 [Acidimicrobiales bacterium]